jgi:hypothetical protein
MTPRTPPGFRRPGDRRTRLTLGIALASVVAMIALFVGVIVVSFELLHKDNVTLDEPATLEPVQFLGEEERVFNWAQDRCDNDDIPDLPARAFRDQAGRVQLISGNLVNRRFLGPSLNQVAHQCAVLMASDENPDPAAFNDSEWIGAPYTQDGRTVYALVHNEYHGYEHPGQCSTDLYSDCWYNAVTLAMSRDGGSTFQDARQPPRHLVAASPYRYERDGGTYGMFSPSNIVRRDDGYFYALVSTRAYRRQAFGTCLLRTDQLGDPTAWRAWDGSDFSIAMISPYRADLGSPHDRVCEPVSPNEIGGMHESLTFNEFLGKYLLVGLSSDRIPRQGGTAYGVYYSVSDDLVDWSRRKLIHETEVPWSYECGDTNPILYPSLLDPRSSSRNFETTGQRPYLYFTRFHYRDCTQTTNRDLVRVQVEFSK